MYVKPQQMKNKKKGIEKETSAMKKSVCLKNGMYRVRRKGKGTISFTNGDLDSCNKQNTSSNQERFEFYPYKPYWFYRLRHFISKKYENNRDIINIFKKIINSWWTRGVLMALTLYAIKEIFNIEI